MRRNFSKNKFLILVLIIFIGIGFALLSTELNINGTTKVKNNKWDIHFENIKIADESVQNDSLQIKDDTTVTFDVTLSKPGDIFKFDVDVINDGTIDAMIDSIALTDIADKDYLNYYATYSDGQTISKGQLLINGLSDTITLAVEFKKDIKDTQLPSEDIDLSLSMTLVYVQADENAESRKTTFYNMMKSEAVSDDFVDFSAPAPATGYQNDNGNGIMLLNTTKNNKFPIYYYRGEVDNNNVLFGDVCWKILRTTETGGTKLIFNGYPSDDGKCDNSGVSSKVSDSKINASQASPADVGYVHGYHYERLDFKSEDLSAGYVYGNDVNYTENVGYSLNNTIKASSTWANDFESIANDTTIHARVQTMMVHAQKLVIYLLLMIVEQDISN